jgi:hypothetical protein
MLKGVKQYYIMVKTKRHHRKHMGTMRNKKMHDKEDICHETTFHGLNDWMKCKFEKLGWMVLAKHKGYKDKTNCYLNSINRLKIAIEDKMNHIHDNDKKEDLEIMLHNVKILQEHAKRDLK